MDTHEEIHAAWFGMTTAFRQKRRSPLPKDIPKSFNLEIAAEYHYYLLGFYVTRAAQIVLPSVVIILNLNLV